MPPFHKPTQALRHPWVLDGRLYSGSGGGSSSDGSEFSGGGGKRDDDLRAPDPQDIPSELLGADSDTEEEEEEQEEEDHGVSREWKAGSDKGVRRPYRQMAQPPPPPQPPVVVVVSAQTGRQSERGGNGGAGGGTATEKDAKTAPLPKANAIEPRGVREEDTVVPHAEPESGGRHASPPMPAPPPSTRAAVVDCAVPSTENKEGMEGGEPRSEDRAGGGGGKGDGEEFDLDGRLLSSPRGGTRTAEAVAAEAAEEEAAAAKEAKKAAITAAAVAAAAVTAAASTASPPSPASLPPPPPLAPVDATQPFVTPRKLRSPRPLDVFSSPPLAPLGSGRALEGDSEFSLDASPALPPDKGRVRSRDGLPPSVPGHARARGESSSGFPLGVVERQLSMGVAGISLAEAEADRRENAAAAAPPAFHDLVKRSTRFMTSGGDGRHSG